MESDNEWTDDDAGAAVAAATFTAVKPAKPAKSATTINNTNNTNTSTRTTDSSGNNNNNSSIDSNQNQLTYEKRPFTVDEFKTLLEGTSKFFKLHYEYTCTIQYFLYINI